MYSNYSNLMVYSSHSHIWGCLFPQNPYIVVDPLQTEEKNLAVNPRFVALAGGWSLRGNQSDRSKLAPFLLVEDGFENEKYW
jgi:hypothetical protein